MIAGGQKSLAVLVRFSDLIATFTLIFKCLSL